MKIIKTILMLSAMVCGVHAGFLFPAEPDVRVRIINTLDSLNIRLSGSWVIRSDTQPEIVLPDSTALEIICVGGSFLISASSQTQLQNQKSVTLVMNSDSAEATIASVPYGVGWWWGGTEDRIYEGEIHLYIDNSDDLCVTVHLPMETYLKGVVPYEIGPTSPLEALKAQAVAARAEAVIALTSKLYSGEHHDLTSDVECQVFSGNLRRSFESDQAVDETRSLVISEYGKPMNAFYASNCGGRAELIQNVWPSRENLKSYQQALPDNERRSGPRLIRNWRARRWIKSSPEVYCNPAYEPALPSWSQKNFRWTREFEIDEISKMLSQDPEWGKLKKIKALKRGVSGRIYQASFIFENGSYTASGELAIRQQFSPSLRSSAFFVSKQKGRFIIRGAGWGHGVGMCQSGAISQASKGISFDQILKHYYVNSELLSVYPHEVGLSNHLQY